MFDLMILLQTTIGTVDLWKFLMVQTPIVIFLGIAVYVLWKQLLNTRSKHEKIIEAKDTQMLRVTEKVLTVAALWDVKSTLNSKEHEKILESIVALEKAVDKLKKND